MGYQGRAPMEALVRVARPEAGFMAAITIGCPMALLTFDRIHTRFNRVGHQRRSPVEIPFCYIPPGVTLYTGPMGMALRARDLAQADLCPMGGRPAGAMIFRFYGLHIQMTVIALQCFLYPLRFIYMAKMTGFFSGLRQLF